MKVIRWILWFVILTLAGLRAGFYIQTARLDRDSPLEAYFLESGMTHRCWRVQTGMPLYPDWQAPPHVPNFFTPGYFLVVGRAARSLGADLITLTLIGRSVSMAATVGLSLIAIWISNRRFGWRAAAVAGLFSIGSAPALGPGYCVRPDLLADFLGMSGFIAVVALGGGIVFWGAALFAMACFVKQTAIIYLIAAVVALIANSQKSRAFGVAATAGFIFVIAGLAYVAYAKEPRFWTDIFGERLLPWSLAHWRKVLGKLASTAPELILLCPLGLWLWRKNENRGLFWLTAVVMVSALVTAAKVGSDVNYFLSWRIPAAIAAGTCFAVGTQRIWVLLALGLAMLYSTAPHAYQAEQAIRLRQMFESVEGRAAIAGLKQLEQMADNPNQPLLTDVGSLALRQGRRAAFVDPWLFRQLVLRGSIDPGAIAERIAARRYATLVLTADPFAPGFDEMPFSLPPPLSRVIRENYLPAGQQWSWFVLVPKRRITAGPPQSTNIR